MSGVFLGDAKFSDCGTYRYTLERDLGDPEGEHDVWVMLNPSTADTQQNDPTITRCINFSKRWGAGRLTILNLFALRSTDPKGLDRIDDPVGPENDQTIREVTAEATRIICGWGVHGAKYDRAAQVLPLLKNPLCLGKTKAGMPRHPLYLRADAELISVSDTIS